MREKYESLPLAVLRDLAKARKMKGISTLKKADLIEAMLHQDELDAAAEKTAAEAAPAPAKAPVKTKKDGTPAKKPGRPRKNPPADVTAKAGEEPAADAAAKASESPAADAAPKVGEKPAAVAAAKTGEEPAAVAAPKTGEESSKKTEQPAERPRKVHRFVSRSDSADRPQGARNMSAERPEQPERGGQSERPAYFDRSSRPERPVQGERTAQPAREAYAEAAQSERPQQGERFVQSDRPQQNDRLVNGERPAQGKVPQDLNYEDAKDALGILEIMQDGYGFLRSDNYMPGDSDVYVSPSQIRRFNLKTGDIIHGKTRKNNPNDKFGALLYITDVNGYDPDVAAKRTPFEDMTPIFPQERIRLERPGCSVAMRVVDMISPVGKGQRGMIVSQPKAGKTTLLKEIARSVIANHPEIHLIILLIDERPEEVTDIRESIANDSVEVIYSTFDETPEHHKRVSEMVIERARRLVEHHKDVMILLDSITRMARAYNLTVAPSGRTLSGGLDPAALHMPKRFFGAARNMREGGSLTILATALVETGSKMDDVVFEEFKGTGNMELVLDRKLSERRIFPAIDINKSGTRRDDLLLTAQERAATDIMHRGLNGRNRDDVTETILNLFAHTKDNEAVLREILRRKLI